MKLLSFNLFFSLLYMSSSVTHLLRNFSGSSPFTVDVNGFTPLHYSANSGHKMAVQMVHTCSYVVYMGVGTW